MAAIFNCSKLSGNKSLVSSLTSATYGEPRKSSSCHELVAIGDTYPESTMPIELGRSWTGEALSTGTAEGRACWPASAHQDLLQSGCSVAQLRVFSSATENRSRDDTEFVKLTVLPGSSPLGYL